VAAVRWVERRTAARDPPYVCLSSHGGPRLDSSRLDRLPGDCRELIGHVTAVFPRILLPGVTDTKCCGSGRSAPAIPSHGARVMPILVLN